MLKDNSENSVPVSTFLFNNQDDIELQIELDERLLIKGKLKHFFAKEDEAQEINLFLPNGELNEFSKIDTHVCTEETDKKSIWPRNDTRNIGSFETKASEINENCIHLSTRPTGSLSLKNDYQYFPEFKQKISVSDFKSLNTFMEKSDVILPEINESEMSQYDLVDAFKCRRCSLIFKDKCKMLDHYNIIHPEEVKSHVIVIDTSGYLGLTHSEKSTLMTPSPKCIVVENAPLFKCESCKAEFIEEGLYSHHMKEEHKSKVSYSKDESKKENLDEKLISYIKKRDESSTSLHQQKCDKSKTPVLKNFRARNLRCGLFGCHLKFSSNECLRNHQSCHDFQTYSKTNYICYICQMEFSKWNGCCFHLWTKHGVDVDILHCNFCESFKATTMHHMSVHQQIHSEEKPFVCSTCNSAFKQQSLLINHRHTHENQEENKTSTWLQKTLCNVCNKWFSSYRSYLQHYQTIHNKVTSYSCPDCKYETYRKSRLAEHMRTHNSPSAYTCEICKFSCADHNSIRRHRLTHLSSKHLRCPAPQCSLQTVYATFFRKHMKKKHSGQELNYGCQFCPFTTSQMERYINHCGEHEKAMVSELLRNNKRDSRESFSHESRDSMTFSHESRDSMTCKSFTANSTEDSDESLSAFDNHFFLKKF